MLYTSIQYYYTHQYSIIIHAYLCSISSDDIDHHDDSHHDDYYNNDRVHIILMNKVKDDNLHPSSP